MAPKSQFIFELQAVLDLAIAAREQCDSDRRALSDALLALDAELLRRQQELDGAHNAHREARSASRARSQRQQNGYAVLRETSRLAHQERTVQRLVASLRDSRRHQGHLQVSLEIKCDDLAMLQAREKGLERLRDMQQAAWKRERERLDELGRDEEAIAHHNRRIVASRIDLKSSF